MGKKQDIQNIILNLPKQCVHLTGIKGAGMTALAEMLDAEGAVVSGSDIEDWFYTDTLLQNIGVHYCKGFDASHVPNHAALLVHSAAYDTKNPEIQKAVRKGIPICTYTEMLGEISRTRCSLAVSGIHGKTSTAAMITSMIYEAKIPGAAIVGGAVPSIGGSSALVQGRDIFVAETCEYRRHFLDFSPTVLIITSVEMDHPDYFQDIDDVQSAFLEFADKLPAGGTLIYCADDSGAVEVAHALHDRRTDVYLVPYGFAAEGEWRCSERVVHNGIQQFRLGQDICVWQLKVPGKHMVSNAAAAAAGLVTLLRYTDKTHSYQQKIYENKLNTFAGVVRRSEIVGQRHGVIIMDDYAHHPKAIRVTLQGLREIYPNRRIIVDFMPHTHSRTHTLLHEFSTAFIHADIVYLNGIYPSAREDTAEKHNENNLFHVLRKKHPCVIYQPDFEKAAVHVYGNLKSGDIFITMGAGDNFRIGITVKKMLYNAVTL